MIIIVKYEFTYQDYLNYCDSIQWNEADTLIMVAEESEEYTYDDEYVGDKKHDKIFKEILQNKEEMSKFLNDFVKFEVPVEELEIYNSEFITQTFKYKQADIVYKLKGKETYFLIEHQTKVDYSMAYRMLNYCVEIMRSVTDGQVVNKAKYRYPTVIPIVLYTGNKTWTASTSIAENQEFKNDVDFRTIDVKYKLIDKNKYSVEELLQVNTMFANVLILEKSKTIEDVTNNLIRILKNTSKGKRRENLKRIVLYLYGNREEVIKIIEKYEEEESMLTAKRIIDIEFKKQRREGKREGKREGRMEGLIEMMANVIKSGRMIFIFLWM